jgi:hypothetical protein
MASNRNYLRIPRDATFPTLPLSEHFEEYAHAYYLAAKYLWDAVPKSYGGVPRPDNLVHPILFLVHHFLELKLKQVIVLSYAIGSMTGELTPNENDRTHDLSSLLRLADSHLDRIEAVPKPLPLSGQTRLFIEDMNKFGMMGEALRYPYHSVKAVVIQRMVGPDFPDAIIPDLPAVIGSVEKAQDEFGGLISYLIEYDRALFEMQRGAYS